MIQLYRFGLIILLITLLCLMPTPTLAAGEPRLVLSAETRPAATGQEIVVRLLVEDASPTVKVQTRLTFDPATLQGVALDHGDFLTRAPATDAFILQNQFDNEAGTLDYALLLKPTQPPAEGNGLVATITFQAKRDGPATIEIQEGFFFDPTGVKIVAQTGSAQLVAGDGTATEVASVVQPQPEPDQAPRTAGNADVIVSGSAMQEQLAPIAPAGQTKPGQAVPTAVSEPEPAAQIPEPSALAPRRFRVSTQPDPATDRLWVLWVIIGIGVIILSAGVVSFMGIVGGWLWLARAERRRGRSRKLTPKSIKHHTKSGVVMEVD